MRTPSLEREPLLSRSSSHRFLSTPSQDPRRNRSIWPSFTTISPKYRWIPLLGCSIIFINEAEYYIKQVATMRAIEAMYCYKFYIARNSPLAELGKHIPERLCKEKSIQKDLAGTAGLIMFVRMLSSILGAIPLGWVADKYGRKVVLILHKVNVTVTCTSWLVLYLGFPRVPIWTLYLSGLPGLIGGNYDVGLAMLFASYTDVMPCATERASLFFLTTSMQYLAQTLCPSIGAWLMNLDGRGGTPQINLTVSLALTIVTVLLTVFVWPETVHESHKASLHEEESYEEQEEQASGVGINLKHTGGRIQGSFNIFKESIGTIGVINITLLALSISFAATGIKAIDWYGLIQYPVIKLHWTFPQASNIVSLQGLLMLLHFSIFLPFLNRALATWLESPGHAHFLIMVASSIFLMLGSLIIGFSNAKVTFVSGTIVYLLGEGLPTATQAYIVSLVEKQKVARVIATLSVTSISGKLVASLAFPKILARGLDSHVDVLIGLPFFVSAGMFIVSAVCFSVVGIRMWEDHEQSREVEDEEA